MCLCSEQAAWVPLQQNTHARKIKSNLKYQNNGSEINILVSLVGPFRKFGLQFRKKRRRDLVSQETMQPPRWGQLWERDRFGLHTREHSKNVKRSPLISDVALAFHLFTIHGCHPAYPGSMPTALTTSVSPADVAMASGPVYFIHICQPIPQT